jgi:DNA-directed RNA polymerase specialized sigma subunit
MTTASQPGVLVIVEEVLGNGKIQRLAASNQHNHQVQPATIIEEEEVLSATTPVTQQSTSNHLSNSSSRKIKHVGQHSNWQALAEKPLWVFFAKIRQIHRTYPENIQVADLHKAIKEELFFRYLPDTLKVARNYFTWKMPKSSVVHQEDLEEAVEAAMWSYLDQFDPHYGTITFMQYFNAKGKSRLLGSITDRLRTLMGFPRDIAKYRRELKPLFRELAFKLNRKPTPEQFLDEYGWETRTNDDKYSYREVITDRLFYSGVFNQRQAISSLNEVTDNDEMQSLANIEARPPSVDTSLNRHDTMRFVLSHIEDKDIQYIIWEYYYNNETDKRICRSLMNWGKKCSLSWVVSKHKEGLRILGERLGRKGLELLARRHDNDKKSTS